jgi:amino acid transporter
MASVILLVGYRFVDGDSAKYFGVVISFAVALTLITYLGIFPAFWVLRNKFPDAHRPYQVPAHRTVSIWLTVVVAVALIQILAPGFGDDWFGDAFRPAGWVGDQGRPYYLAQLAVLAIIVVKGTAFWAIGRRNLNNVASSEPEAEQADIN